MPQLSVLLHSARPPAWRRGAFFLAAGALVVLLHAALLTTLAPAWIDPEEPLAAAPVLSVRSVPAAPTTAPVPESMPVTTVPAALPRPRAAAQQQRPAQRMPASGPIELQGPASRPLVAAPVDAAPAARGSDSIRAPSVPAQTEAAAVEVPVYATRLPAAGSWPYLLQRGIASGEARLTWEPDAEQRYSMRLEGSIAGLTVLDWRSTGALDHAGIAPERFAIRRRGKDSQAANFQRDAGKITFSGPTHELALLPGVQDRLSWMLQLPAVIDAAPERFGAGSNVVLMVIGARGGADIWTFTVEATEPLDGLTTLKLVRDALKPHDVRVEVWLDPARGHLPVRALLSQVASGAPLELTLQKGSTGP